MADTVKISELPLATALTGAEFVPIVQGGETVRATAAQLLPIPVTKFVFDITNESTPAKGEMNWNATDGTVDVGLDSDVTLKVGQQLHMKVRNTSGATIAKGTLVSATGTAGNTGRINIGKSDGSGTVSAIFIVGITDESIANNADGFLTAFGVVRGINTTGAGVSETWADGDVLYPHPTIAGGLTKGTHPLDLPIAFVLNAGNNGSLFVRR
jgi:hypothetical protein